MKKTIRSTAGASARTSTPALRAALLTPVAVAAAAAGVLLAPAVPALAASAEVEIGLLEAQGFDVRVDRIGSAPLDQCEITNVRNPQEQKQIVRVDGRGDRDRVIEVVVKRTITVSLDCSR
jgi:hypothetical protein